MSNKLSEFVDKEGISVDRTQSELIDLFNQSGKVMASMPDFYELAKSEDDKLLEEIKEDLEIYDHKIVSSTKIDYELNSLEATITHYFGSKIIKSITRKVKIPELRRFLLHKAYAEHLDIQNYLQALFNTNDNVETIKRNLEKLIGQEAHQIQLWTPPAAARDMEDFLESATGFYKDIDDQFVIYGDVVPSNLEFKGIAFSVDKTPEYASPIKEEKNELFCELSSKIDKKSCCVHFTKLDEYRDFSKYSGLFCFHNKRFVVSLTLPLRELEETEKENINKEITTTLAIESSSEEKMSSLTEKFSPLYAHISKYTRLDQSYELIDDIEAFGKPRVKVNK